MKLLVILLYSTSIIFITTSTISAEHKDIEIEKKMSSYTIVNKKTPITENVISLKSVKKAQNYQIYLELNNLQKSETSNNKTTFIMVILFIVGLLLFFGYIRHWKTKIKKETDSKKKKQS